MDEASREGGLKTTQKLLALWTGKEATWLTYKEIVNTLRDHGIGERTVARYLASLVHSRKLMKEERGYKKTFYKPYDEFLRRLSLSRDFFGVIEESFSLRAKDIVNRYERTILDSKEADERISKLIVDEIDRIPEGSRSDEDVAKVMYKVLSREKLTESDSKILVSKVERFLFEAFYHFLADPFGCAGVFEPHINLTSLERAISLLLSHYMELWAFIYEHPGASFEFEKYMREKFPNLPSYGSA